MDVLTNQLSAIFAPDVLLGDRQMQIALGERIVAHNGEGIFCYSFKGGIDPPSLEHGGRGIRLPTTDLGEE